MSLRLLPMRLKCYDDYCIFNNNFKCTLDELPSINHRGMCEKHTGIALDHDFLERAKRRQLQRSRLRLVEEWE